jgi:phosphoribosyl 1,2-cyclic phosphodiesterase
MSELRFAVLASGSKGNCAWLASEHSQLLIDCGIGPRTLAGLMSRIGARLAQIDAVLITHTHGDHVQGLLPLLRHCRPRIYAPGAHVAELRNLLGSAQWTEIVPIEAEQGFFHRDIDILPVEVSHDCPPTVMYKLHHGHSTVGVLTDLGEVQPRHTALFGDCDVLLLESNHCPLMLRSGPYPEVLKRRIASRLGHLSNAQAYQFAAGLARLPRLFLGHLSDENNSPQAASLAFGVATNGAAPPGFESEHRPAPRPPELFDAAAAAPAEAIPHTVIPQRTVGPLIEL